MSPLNMVFQLGDTPNSKFRYIRHKSKLSHVEANRYVTRSPFLQVPSGEATKWPEKETNPWNGGGLSISCLEVWEQGAQNKIRYPRSCKVKKTTEKYRNNIATHALRTHTYINILYIWWYTNARTQIIPILSKPRSVKYLSQDQHRPSMFAATNHHL